MNTYKLHYLTAFNIIIKMGKKIFKQKLYILIIPDLYYENVIVLPQIRNKNILKLNANYFIIKKGKLRIQFIIKQKKF